VRLFFAIALPDGVRTALARLQTDDPNYRWVDAAQLHITLAFLGEQPESRLTDLQRIGEAAASASSKSTLKLSEPGSFGPRSAPRVLWIGVASDVPALMALQSKLSDGLRNGGFAVEERPFQAHITLARRRERSAGRTPPPWPPEKDVQPAEIPLDELKLFQSRLSPRGATYVPLATFALRGQANHACPPGQG
jgi:2'-5' RNA ligase